MKLRMIYCFSLILGVVLFSYGTANAQDVVDAVEKAAEVTKDATVKAAKKTAEVTKDAAKATKKGTVKTAKKTADVTGDVVEDAVDVTKEGYDKADDVAADAAKVTKKGAKKVINEGEYVTVSAWDGTKWVSKKVKKGTLKGVEKTEEGIEIVGEEAEEIID